MCDSGDSTTPAALPMRLSITQPPEKQDGVRKDIVYKSFEELNNMKEAKVKRLFRFSEALDAKTAYFDEGTCTQISKLLIACRIGVELEDNQQPSLENVKLARSSIKASGNIIRRVAGFTAVLDMVSKLDGIVASNQKLQVNMDNVARYNDECKSDATLALWNCESLGAIYEKMKDTKKQKDAITKSQGQGKSDTLTPELSKFDGHIKTGFETGLLRQSDREFSVTVGAYIKVLTGKVDDPNTTDKKAFAVLSFSSDRILVASLHIVIASIRFFKFRTVLSAVQVLVIRGCWLLRVRVCFARPELG